MGFSVQASNAGGAPIEWAGNDLNSVFTQRKNLLRPAFWSMLRDIVRFNKAATQYALHPANTHETLGEYLQTNGYSDALRDWYLVPMAAAIWSCPTATMMGYPMATFARFCHNHGLLQITNRPQWYTVQGGSRNYVNKVLANLSDVRLGQAVTQIARDVQGVTVQTNAGTERFDAVILACHSDQALQMISPSPQEAALLGAIAYQNNTAVLHTDASLLPSHRRAWAAWNYETRQSANAAHSQQQVCLHYLLNKLQPLPVSDAHPVIVSLNPLPEHMPRLDTVIQTFDYAHPVFNTAAIEAQRALPSIQGDHTGQRSWFAGAWTNYGFHEDGFQSGKAAAMGVLKTFGPNPQDHGNH
jgi:predicted NAD/FAD-binding protein